MSRKTVSAVIGSFLAIGFALGAVQGCGSSSSSGNFAADCMKGCARTVPCEADAGLPITMAECVQSCTNSGKTSSGATCTNSAAMENAAEACLSKTTCADLETCLETTIPTCAGGTGGTSGTGTGGSGAGANGGSSGATGGTTGATGGTTGATGGATGTGGSGTVASCAVCDKAASCCTAVGLPTSECSTFSASACSAMTGTTQTTFAQDCQTIVNDAAAGNIACP